MRISLSKRDVQALRQSCMVEHTRKANALENAFAYVRRTKYDVRFGKFPRLRAINGLTPSGENAWGTG